MAEYLNHGDPGLTQNFDPTRPFLAPPQAQWVPVPDGRGGLTWTLLPTGAGGGGGSGGGLPVPGSGGAKSTVGAAMGAAGAASTASTLGRAARVGLAGGAALAGMRGGGSGSGSGSGGSMNIPPELAALIDMQIQQQKRRQLMTDPSAAGMLGMDAPEGAVPLQGAIAQLAYSLMPNSAKAGLTMPGQAPDVGQMPTINSGGGGGMGFDVAERRRQRSAQEY